MTMRAITLYTPYERQHGVIVDSKQGAWSSRAMGMLEI